MDVIVTIYLSWTHQERSHLVRHALQELRTVINAIMMEVDVLNVELDTSLMVKESALKSLAESEKAKAIVLNVMNRVTHSGRLKKILV
jgi:hypothetical protein